MQYPGVDHTKSGEPGEKRRHLTLLSTVTSFYFYIYQKKKTKKNKLSCPTILNNQKANSTQCVLSNQLSQQESTEKR